MPFCHIRLRAHRPLPSSYPKALYTLGDHLRKKRLDLGLLQKDIAKILGGNVDSVCNWENSRASPRLYLTPRIVKFLGYVPDQPTSTDPGLRIRLIRRSLGIRQDLLAQQLEVDPSTLGRWERGKGQPLAKNMRKVNEFLKTVSLDHQT